jgi:hypothetical protein
MLVQDTCQFVVSLNNQKHRVELTVKEKTAQELVEDLRAEVVGLSSRLDRRVLGFSCKPANLKVDFLLMQGAAPVDILSGKTLNVEPFLGEPLRLQKKVNILNFKVLRCIGAGGFAKVFLVRSRLDGKFYAMKLIHKEILS